VLVALVHLWYHQSVGLVCCLLSPGCGSYLVVVRSVLSLLISDYGESSVSSMGRVYQSCHPIRTSTVLSIQLVATRRNIMASRYA
jgi:hypothetical protein